LRVNEIGPDGAKHLSEALVTNTTLKELEYAAPTLPRTRAQRPNLLLAAPNNSISHSCLVCSLGGNDLKAEGAKHLCDALKVNKTLTKLMYAALHLTTLLSPARARLLLLAAADTLSAPSFNLFRPSLSCRASLCSLRNNIIGPDGAKHLSEALVTNTTLTELKYAACPSRARNGQSTVSSR
jgi:Ran GTPase-activating protein (RanGAP) involved in mRNA processing and transport